MSQTIRDGCLSRKICAPKPSLPVAPGARFWTKTSALSIMRASTSLAPSCLRSRVRDSLERLSQTKWLARPFTVLSYPRAKSPTSGRSTFMTRAPRSASWRVAKGAATACSKETTVMPSSGSILERPRQTQDVLGDVGEDQVGRDGCYLVEARLAELALDVVLGVEAVAAEGLHRDVRRLPGGLRRQELRQVRLRSAGRSLLEEGGGFLDHERGRLDARVRPRKGELDALVLPDGPAEDLAFLRPRGRSVDKEAAVADALGGDQDALGVHAVQHVAETLPLLTDEVLQRYPQVLEEQLVGGVVHHDAPGFDGETVGVSQIHEKDRESLRALLDLLQGRRAGEEDHEVRLRYPGDVDLAPSHHVMVIVAPRGSPYGGRIGPGLRFGDGEGLQPQLSARYFRQVLSLLPLRAMPQERPHRVHLGVGGTGVGAAAVDLLQDGAGRREVETHPAVLLRYERREVAGLAQRLDELPRVAALGVELSPVLVREAGTYLPHAAAQFLAGHAHPASPGAGLDVFGA